MSQYVTATDDSATFKETDTISGNLLENDTANNGGSIFLRFFDGVSVGAKKGVTQVTTIEGEHGTFYVKPDGSYSYVLHADAKIGFVDGQTLTEHLSYKISDGAGHTDVGLFTLNIQGVTQTKPVAVDDSFSFTEGSAIGGNVLSNDIPGDNGKLFLRQFDGTSVDAKNGGNNVTDVAGQYGTFHVKPNGEFTYTLNTDVAAGASVTEKIEYYKISDGSGHTDVGVLTLNITGTDYHPALA